MSKIPVISIVVPARNVRGFVGKTLASIQTQTFADWECVVVDDGSDDGTPEEVVHVVGADSRFRLVRQSCGGASLARNRGFMETNPHARFVTFMDSDDVWHEHALQTLFNRIECQPDAVGAHGLAEFIDRNGAVISEGAFPRFGRRRLGFAGKSIVEWPAVKPTVFETLIWTGPLYPPGLLLARREAYEKAGLYDVLLKHCEDWDMCLRLSRHGRIEFVDEVLLQYRRHERNQSNDLAGSAKMVRQLHHKTFFSEENSAQQREVLKRGWRAWQRFKIGEKWRAAFDSNGVQRMSALMKALVATPVHALRAVRGYPTRIWF